eukprot:12695954-Alexandrium_andersonii.AAC.1
MIDDASEHLAVAQSRANRESARAFGRWLDRALSGSAGPAHKWAAKPNRPSPPACKIWGGRVCVTPNEVLEARVQHWTAMWNRVEADTDAACVALSRLRLQAERSPLQPLSTTQVIGALKALRGTRGIGVDQWHPSLILAAPVEAVEQLTH